MSEELFRRAAEALERIATAVEKMVPEPQQSSTYYDPLAHFWAANPDAKKKFDELMARKKGAA